METNNTSSVRQEEIKRHYVTLMLTVRAHLQFKLFAKNVFVTVIIVIVVGAVTVVLPCQRT